SIAPCLTCGSAQHSNERLGAGSATLEEANQPSYHRPQSWPGNAIRRGNTSLCELLCGSRGVWTHCTPKVLSIWRGGSGRRLRPGILRVRRAICGAHSVAEPIWAGRDLVDCRI